MCVVVVTCRAFLTIETLVRPQRRSIYVNSSGLIVQPGLHNAAAADRLLELGFGANSRHSLRFEKPR
jgi:hypothetical protein